jgi:hypothetical protein
VLVDAKTFVGSFDEETESVYLGNGTRKTQIETVPIVYSSYSSSVFRNQYNYNYDCVMEHSIKTTALSCRTGLTRRERSTGIILESSTGTRTATSVCRQVHQSVVLSRYYGNDRVLQNAFCGRGQYRDVLSVLNELKIVCK